MTRMVVVPTFFLALTLTGCGEEHAPSDNTAASVAWSSFTPPAVRVFTEHTTPMELHVGVHTAGEGAISDRPHLDSCAVRLELRPSTDSVGQPVWTSHRPGGPCGDGTWIAVPESVWHASWSIDATALLGDSLADGAYTAQVSLRGTAGEQRYDGGVVYLTGDTLPPVWSRDSLEFTATSELMSDPEDPYVYAGVAVHNYGRRRVVLAFPKGCASWIRVRGTNSDTLMAKRGCPQMLERIFIPGRAVVPAPEMRARQPLETIGLERGRTGSYDLELVLELVNDMSGQSPGDTLVVPAGSITIEP